MAGWNHHLCDKVQLVYSFPLYLSLCLRHNQSSCFCIKTKRRHSECRILPFCYNQFHYCVQNWVLLCSWFATLRKLPTFHEIATWALAKRRLFSQAIDSPAISKSPIITKRNKKFANLPVLYDCGLFFLWENHSKSSSMLMFSMWCSMKRIEF